MEYLSITDQVNIYPHSYLYYLPPMGASSLSTYYSTDSDKFTTAMLHVDMDPSGSRLLNFSPYGAIVYTHVESCFSSSEKKLRLYRPPLGINQYFKYLLSWSWYWKLISIKINLLNYLLTDYHQHRYIKITFIKKCTCQWKVLFTNILTITGFDSFTWQ